MDDPLTDAQCEHVDRLERILDGFVVAIDQSQQGSGKTRCAQALAVGLGLPIFVVRPGIVNAWEQEAEMTQVQLVESISYERLMATPGTTTMAHGWLTRRDSSSGSKRAEFTATADWVRRVDQGVLLVVDEAQNVKNESDKSSAVQELVRVIVDAWWMGVHGGQVGRSRVVLLSGSLFDKAKHATRMCQVMGLLRPGKPSDPHEVWDASIFYLWFSWQERNPGGPSWSAFERFIWLQFREDVLPLVSSSMPLPELEIETDAAVGFFYMDEPEKRELSMAIHDLRVSLEQSDHLALLATMRAHRAKVGMVVRLASGWLDANLQGQVVVFGAYNDSLSSISEGLQRFQPSMLTGETPHRDRAQILDSFQQGSTRLLVANALVGGTGINLHDVHGGRPRCVLLLPTHSAIVMEQAMYRCTRMGTRSDVLVRVLFGLGAEEEMRLLANLGRKTEVMRQLVPGQVEQGKLFLEDLPQYREGADRAGLGSIVALEADYARQLQLQIPAPAARLRTFEDLLRHIAQSAVDNKLESLHGRFPLPGQGLSWDAYVISKRGVEHINELWQQLDEKSGNRMKERWVTHYRYRDPVDDWGVIGWVESDCSSFQWSFGVTESGAVGELQKGGCLIDRGLLVG